MRSDVYEKLSPPVRRLVDEIEAKAGFEIAIRPEATRGDVGQVIETPETAVGAMMAWNEAAVEYPGRLEDVTQSDWVHEILHLHRAYVQDIPHLYPKTMKYAAAASSIDNWLEHMVIYEQQIELCPGFREALNVEMLKFWRVTFPGAMQGADLAMNLLSRFVITKLYGSPATIKAMTKKLRKGGFERKAENLGAMLIKLLGDKHELVRVFLPLLGVSTSHFWLRRFDIPNKCATWVDI